MKNTDLIALVRPKGGWFRSLRYLNKNHFNLPVQIVPGKFRGIYRINELPRRESQLLKKLEILS